MSMVFDPDKPTTGRTGKVYSHPTTRERIVFVLFLWAITLAIVGVGIGLMIIFGAGAGIGIWLGLGFAALLTRLFWEESRY